MTGILLMDALINSLNNLFADELLKSKSGELKKIKVFAQYLPEPRTLTVKPKGEEPIEYQDYGPADLEDNFPCIIVKLGECRDAEENKLDQAVMDINFLIGVYDKTPDNQGYIDVLNIIDKIRLHFWHERYLDKKFRLEPDMRFYLFDDQPAPVFFGVIETRWDVPRPLEFCNFDDVFNFVK